MGVCSWKCIAHQLSFDARVAAGSLSVVVNLGLEVIEGKCDDFLLTSRILPDDGFGIFLQDSWKISVYLSCQAGYRSDNRQRVVMTAK